MKTSNFIKLPAVALLLAVGACTKNSANDSTSSLSTDDAVSLMANAVASGSGGMVTASADVTLNAQLTFNANPGCGGTKTYNFSHQSPSGSTITYSYAYNYSYTLNCVNNVPDNVTSTSTSTGSYDGPNITSSDSGTFSTTVGGLALTGSAYTLSGEYKRAGSFTQKTGSMNKGTSSIDIVLSNVIIPKTGGSIASGSATFTLTGTGNNGAFSFNGNIAFTGNNQATININSTVYIVNLLTGAATKQ